jgi:capsular polysaccharide biosynthesis protein
MPFSKSSSLQIANIVGAKGVISVALSASVRQWAILHAPDWLHPAMRTMERGGNAVAGAALRLLPGTSRDIGPPRRISPTLRQYAALHPSVATYTEIRPSHVMRRVLPRTVGTEMHPAFTRELTRQAWPAGVGVIKNGRVLASMGSVIGPKDHFIADVSHTAGSDDARLHPIFSELKLPPVQRYESSVAVLTMYASNIAGHPFYGHWMLDTLPRLALLEASGVPWEKLVVPQVARFQRETLKLLGIDASRIIADRDLHIEAANLVVPTLPGLPGNPPRWACEFLRSRFVPLAPPATRSDRRIYISRDKAKTRHVLNEREIVLALEARGFERVLLEDLPFLEQVRLLNEASFVVAPHTTGLTNLVFCRPGTSVIEIFAPRYVTVCWWALANEVDLDYGYVLGLGKCGGGYRVHEDITVDLPQVLRLLDEMLENPRRDRRASA